MSLSRIIIHCSDTPNGRSHNAEDIHRWHLERGWDGIGYHHVITLDGLVENGRPRYWMGSHASGFNGGSIGICLIGRDEFTDAQWRALEGLVLALHYEYPEAEVVGHNELSTKSCPGFNVTEWWVNVKNREID